MGDKSGIQWTEATWNPAAGCSLVSPGCRNCYAMRVAYRLAQNPNPKIAARYAGLTRMTEHGPVWTGQVRCIDDALTLPLRWRRPRRIFVNSMSDLFHPGVPTQFIDRVLEVMGACNGENGRPGHIFQVLTKRPELMEEKLYRVTESNPCRVLGGGDYLPNVWWGTSCEDQSAADARIKHLLRIPARVLFLSLEPLLGPIDLQEALRLAWHEYPELQWRQPHWVIIGGESGPGARPCKLEWVRGIIRQCRRLGIRVFVKQLGTLPIIPEARPAAVAQGAQAQRAIDLEWPLGTRFGNPTHNPAYNGRVALLRGHGDPEQWPVDVRLREYPL